MVLSICGEKCPVEALGAGGQLGVVNVSPRAGDWCIRSDRFPTPGTQRRAGLKGQQNERRGPQDESRGPVRGPGNGGEHRRFDRVLVAADIAVKCHPGDGRQGSAIQRAAGIHRDGLVGKDRALEYREGADDRRCPDLPEDILRLRTAREDDVDHGSHLQIGRDLEDPDVIRATGEREVRTGNQRRASELVEARGEVEATEVSGSRIEKRTGGNGRPSGGVIVGGCEIPHRFRQDFRRDHRAGGSRGIHCVDRAVHLCLGHADCGAGDRTRADISINDAAPRTGDCRTRKNGEWCGRSQVNGFWSGCKTAGLRGQNSQGRDEAGEYRFHCVYRQDVSIVGRVSDFHFGLCIHVVCHFLDAG